MAQIYKIALTFLFFAVAPLSVEAATLSFTPAAGSYPVGSTLSVSVSVGSADRAMNAASGVVSFPHDKLEVSSLSKSGSIFTLWVQEPAFSNTEGGVNFEGIVLNPGFTGSIGKIITIHFRVKAAGTALLNFSTGSVLANDGKGTNILTGLGSAKFSLGGAVPAISEALTPAAPQISSPTHPDQNKSYSDSSPEFIWTSPQDITASRILYDKNPDSRPTVVYDPPIFKKKLNDLKDGIYYFHVQLKNKNGWGNIAHFRFQIDTTKPSEPPVMKGEPTATSTAPEATVTPALPPRIEPRVINFSLVVILLVLVIAALLTIILRIWRRLSVLKKRLRKEVRDTESVLHKEFDILKDTMREQIKLLEKTRTRRQLTKEEEKIIQQLKQDLDNAESAIKKEVEDIENEIK